MCKWIRQLVQRSPLELLELSHDEFYYAQEGANFSYDGLVEHLILKHGDTLRVLKMGSALVGTKKLVEMLRLCRVLEVCEVNINPNCSVRPLFDNSDMTDAVVIVPG